MVHSWLAISKTEHEAISEQLPDVLSPKLVTVSSNQNSSQKKKDSRILRRSALQNPKKQESKNQTTLENAPRIRNTIQCLKKIKKRMTRKGSRNNSKKSVFGNENNLTVKKTGINGNIAFRKQSCSRKSSLKGGYGFRLEDTGQKCGLRSNIGFRKASGSQKNSLKGSLGFRKASSSQRRKSRKSKVNPAYRSGVGWRRKQIPTNQHLQFNINRNHQLRGSRRTSKPIFSQKRSQPVTIGPWDSKHRGRNKGFTGFSIEQKKPNESKKNGSWKPNKIPGAVKSRGSKSKTYSYSRKGSKLNNRQAKLSNAKHRSSQKIIRGVEKKKNIVNQSSNLKRAKSRNSNIKTIWSQGESRDHFYRFSRSPRKPSGLAQNDFESVLNGDIRSFSRRRLMTSHPRQFSPSLRMRSLRRETEHILFSQNREKEKSKLKIKPKNKSKNNSKNRSKTKKKTQKKISQTVHRFSRNFSIKDFQSQIDLNENPSLALAPPDKNFQRIGNRNLSQRKKMSNLKPKRSPIKEGNEISNLRRNFSNFHLRQKEKVGIGRKSSLFKDQRLMTRGGTRNLLTQGTCTGLGMSRSCSRQITWVPNLRSGTGLEKRQSRVSGGLLLPKSRNITKRSVSKTKREINYGLSMFGGKVKSKKTSKSKQKSKSKRKSISQSKKRTKKLGKKKKPIVLMETGIGEMSQYPIEDCNKYNSMHINSVPQEESYLIHTSQAKASFKRKNGCKGVSMLTEVCNKPQIKKIGSRKKLKSKPILKELVAQLKGNDSLQLEILKSLGCNLKNIKGRSPKPKKKLRKKGKLSSKERTRLERLKRLNCLINNDQQQVSKLKNQLQRSAYKGNQDRKTENNIERTTKRSNSKQLNGKFSVRKTSKSTTRKPKSHKFGSKQRSYINLKKNTSGSKTGTRKIVLNPLTANSPCDGKSFQIEPKSLQNNNLISFPFNSKISQCSGSNGKQKSFSKRKAPERLYLLLDSSTNQKKRKGRKVGIKGETSKSHKNLFPREGKKENMANRELKGKQRIGRLRLHENSPIKRQMMRDQDIKNHMNLILINGVYLDQKRGKKGGQSSVIYIPNKRFPRFS